MLKENNKIKYVVFDCWDTVIKLIEKFPHSSIKVVYDHCLNKEEVDYDQLCKEDDEFIAEYFSNSPFDVHQKALFAYLCESRGLKLDISYEEAAHLSSMAFLAPMVPGVDKFIKFLKNHGIGCSILSNSIQDPEDTIELVTKNFETNPFDYILSSSAYAVKKPDVRFYNLIAKKTGMPKEQTAFIGDSISSDMRGAHNAGMIPFFFNWKKAPYSEETKQELGFTEFTSYDELIEIFKERI